MLPTCKFGKFIIPGAHLFYESALSVGIVNLKPIVPGHVLVIPKRPTARFAELSKEEAADLWAAVHHIGPILELQHNCSALNLAIQDGSAAGQSVPHLHVHMLPRKDGDFERNDDVYEHLERQQLTKVFSAEEERRPRSHAEMAAEARILRTLFPLNSPERYDEGDRDREREKGKEAASA